MKSRAALAVLGMVSALALSAPATAQDSGFYAAFHLGQATLKDFCSDVGGPGVSCDEKDTAWKILGGYQFNRNLALELGYTDFGEATVAGPGIGGTLAATAFEVVAVGMLPIADRFSIYGKIGIYRGDTEANGLGGSASETNTDLTFGIGAGFNFTRNLGVRAEWQKYQDIGGGVIGEGDVDVVSIGLLWKF
jgi:OmpA-OmpF porin, OOP family